MIIALIIVERNDACSFVIKHNSQSDCTLNSMRREVKQYESSDGGWTVKRNPKLEEKVLRKSQVVRISLPMSAYYCEFATLITTTL